MDYQMVFNKKFYEMIILLIIGIFGAIFFLVDKSYWNQFEYLKNNNDIIKDVRIKNESGD